MSYFMQVGKVPKKRFSQHRQADGTLYAAEVMGEEGFSSAMSMLYHLHTPSAVLDAQAIDGPQHKLVANQPLLPRLMSTSQIAGGADTLSGRQVLCGNADVTVSFVTASGPGALYRNASADELFYIHEGAATLETSFGSIDAVQGDYVVIPRSTTHRWVPSAETPLRALAFETAGHIRPPKRYLTQYGQYHQEAPYSELDLKRPEGPLLVDEREVEVLVKTGAGWTRYVYQRHPFDVVGWFGCNYPYALNIRDFSPITGSFHRPPPVHQVFEAKNCVFCNFVPRMLDYDERAMPIPSYHANVDSDELIFYAEGNFFSRQGSGIERGALSLHPAGHVHGPQPAAWASGGERVGKRTEECAVMLDTFRPLLLNPQALSPQSESYYRSWNAKDGQA